LVECLGKELLHFEFDDELNFCGLPYRKLAKLFSLQDAPGVEPGYTSHAKNSLSIS